MGNKTLEEIQQLKDAVKAHVTETAEDIKIINRLQGIILENEKEIKRLNKCCDTLMDEKAVLEQQMVAMAKAYDT